MLENLKKKTTTDANICFSLSLTWLIDFEDCLSPVQAYLFCLENVWISSLYAIRVVDLIALNQIRALFSSFSPWRPLQSLQKRKKIANYNQGAPHDRQQRFGDIITPSTRPIRANRCDWESGTLHRVDTKCNKLMDPQTKGRTNRQTLKIELQSTQTLLGDDRNDKF